MLMCIRLIAGAFLLDRVGARKRRCLPKPPFYPHWRLNRQCLHYRLASRSFTCDGVRPRCGRQKSRFVDWAWTSSPVRILAAEASRLGLCAIVLGGECSASMIEAM